MITFYEYKGSDKKHLNQLRLRAMKILGLLDMLNESQPEKKEENLILAIMAAVHEAYLQGISHNIDNILNHIECEYKG